ncbi:MAG: cysteine--tRNA ligase [Planctomycetota bacterium]|nr:cysteine--tRNA ligase [Planctomycetota bacterium]
MALKLYNTLSNEVETFLPLDQEAARREGRPARVTFYSCGPTVYDFAHVGNFRSFLAADTLRRWLESPLCEGGHVVKQVMNITDVGHMVDDADAGGEDKMEEARRRLLEQKKSGKLPAGAEGTLDPTDPFAIADFYARAFLEDAGLMGLRVVADAEKSPELMPRPTRYIAPMLEMVEALLEKGHAYTGSDGVVYFDTQSFPDYGRLSGNTLDMIRSGAGGRVSESTQSVKRHPADFMLWKPDPRHLMRWDPEKVLGRATALREGYPGWHLECSAMARALLGPMIDLHSGGEDNIFPHHECEIAQSRCAHGTPIFARHWFHPRFLMVEGSKMSKSKGNFYTVGDLVKKGFDPSAIRLELVKTHYRSNANFTEQGLKDSGRMVERWRAVAEAHAGTAGAGAAECAEAARGDEAAASAAERFARALNDDLNVAEAIAVVNQWIRGVREPREVDSMTMRLFDGVLGVLERRGGGAASAGGEDEARIEELVRRRAVARETKNWTEADKIRKELDALGVVVTDSAGGPTWSRRASL